MNTKSKGKECTCGVTSQRKSKTCIICKQILENIPLTEMERQVLCKQHKMIPFCGLPDFVCSICEDAGWYSTAGMGGPRRLINKITGETLPC